MRRGEKRNDQLSIDSWSLSNVGGGDNRDEVIRCRDALPFQTDEPSARPSSYHASIAP
jgi:hypothetical protein